MFPLFAEGLQSGLGGMEVPQWPLLCFSATTGRVCPNSSLASLSTSTEPHSGRIAVVMDHLLIETSGWKPACNDSLSQPLSPPFRAAVIIFSVVLGPPELKAQLQLHLGLLGRGFPAQQSRVRLCSRHIPGGCVCVEPEKSWTLLRTSIINSHLKASSRRWAENHSLCFTLRMLHLYVCVKTGDFHKWLCCQGLELCTGNLVLHCIAVNNSTFLWIY